MRNAKRPTKAEETRRMIRGESVLGTDVLLPGYPTLKIDSKKTLFKKKIGVLLTSNKPFVRTHPTMALFFE
jgi:hypothetical protein